MVWSRDWNGLESRLEWSGVKAGMVWSQGWNGLGVMLDTYTISVGYLLEKISVHSSRVFEANIAANFVLVSGCKRTQKGQPHHVWLVHTRPSPTYPSLASQTLSIPQC